MTVPAKQKVSVSLDADLVSAFEVGGPLSPQVNDALRTEWERRRRAAALDELLAALEERDGPLDKGDEEAIAGYVDLLS